MPPIWKRKCSDDEWYLIPWTGGEPVRLNKACCGMRSVSGPAYLEELADARRAQFGMCWMPTEALSDSVAPAQHSCNTASHIQVSSGVIDPRLRSWDRVS
jgi:hypothetical protein